MPPDAGHDMLPDLGAEGAIDAPADSAVEPSSDLGADATVDPDATVEPDAEIAGQDLPETFYGCPCHMGQSRGSATSWPLIVLVLLVGARYRRRPRGSPTA